MPLELNVKRTRFSLGVCNKAGVHIIICNPGTGHFKRNKFYWQLLQKVAGGEKSLEESQLHMPNNSLPSKTMLSLVVPKAIIFSVEPDSSGI